MTTKALHEMSDDEIAGMTPEQFAALASDEVVLPDEEVNNPDPAPQDPAPVEEENPTPTDEPNPTPDDEDEEDPAPAAEDKNRKRDESGRFTPKAGEKEAKVEDKPAGKAADKVDDGKAAEAPVVNFEDQVKALFAPFKANGRDIQVTNVDEARQLMQMGANYNKKMQGLRPHLATIRTLENAKIGEAELNFLIDLHNGVPEAINKLVKDRGIDPMDLTPEKADGYKPQNHKASEADVELDSVLHELEGSQGLAKTIEVVTKQWDVKSRVVVAENPQLLKVINGHVEAGVYDKIAAKVDRERMLGRLNGLTDLEAYRQVGDAMHASGEFASAGGSATTNDQQAPANVIADPNPKKADDSKRNAQKRGVAPVKAAAPSAKLAPDFNPLSMSDEDFMKQFNGKF